MPLVTNLESGILSDLSQVTGHTDIGEGNTRFNHRGHRSLRAILEASSHKLGIGTLGPGDKTIATQGMIQGLASLGS